MYAIFQQVAFSSGFQEEYLAKPHVDYPDSMAAAKQWLNLKQ